MSQRRQLSREEQEKYTRIFMDLDKDRNGWLSREEVGDWLRGAGFKLTEQQIENIFRIIDTNADGRISLDEFYTAMDLIENPSRKTSDLLRVFQGMDTNGDGQLSEDELFEGLNQCGYSLTRQQIWRMMTNLDRNNDGQINFQEFLAAFKN